MPDLVPVSGDPFAPGPQLQPVEGDPFGGPQLAPVSGDPFGGTTAPPLTVRRDAAAFDPEGTGSANYDPSAGPMVADLPGAAAAAGATLASGHAASDLRGWIADSYPDGPGALRAAALTPAMMGAGALDGAVSGVTAARDAMAGRFDPMSDEGIGRAGAMAGLMGGAGLPMAEDGAVGIFGGRLSATADHAAADRAEAMLRAGEDPHDVLEQTGWFRGNDGAMRYEIPDDGATLRGSTAAAVAARADTVGGALNHPSLFAAYPDLADMTFTTQGVPAGARGAYAAGGPGGLFEELRLSPNLGGTEGTSTTLHELQHAIQQREGFASGSNPVAFDQDAFRQATVDPVYARLQDAMAASPEAANAYQARQTARDDLIRKYGPDWYGNAKASELDHWHALDDALTALPGGAAIDEADFEHMKAATDYLAGRGFRQWQMDQYRRTAGEVEARNVQARQAYTPQERREVAPWTTQDTPDESQVVRLGAAPGVAADTGLLTAFIGRRATP